MNKPSVSIITPAFNATDHIARSVNSVIQQNFEDWEMLIIADDENDYKKVLEEQDISDDRIKFYDTGKIGSGASKTRNVGLNNASANFIAVLDADDEFTSDRLEKTVNKIIDYPLITTAVDIYSEDGNLIRNVGKNRDEGPLSIDEYGYVNFSTHNIIVFDKTKIPARYHEKMKSLNDYAFIVSCLEYVDEFYHIPEPLYKYYKQPGSISNSEDSQEKYMRFKKLIKNLAIRGKLSSKDSVNKAVHKFIEISTEAEELFSKETDPDVLFEDVIERILKA